MPRKINAVILDLDETLISSKEAILAFFKKAFKHLALPYPKEQESVFYTGTERGILHKLIPDERKRKEFKAYAANYSFENHIDDLTLKPHALETVKALYGTYKLAVATNRGLSTPRVLSHFGFDPYLEIAIHARTLANPKPHPIVMETIFKHLGVTAEEAISVGDSEVDVQSAKNVGMACVILDDGLAAGQGDYAIKNLGELPELLDRLQGLK